MSSPMIEMADQTNLMHAYSRSPLSGKPSRRPKLISVPSAERKLN